MWRKKRSSALPYRTCSPAQGLGTFDIAGGVPAQYIAKWDGSTWRGLGSTYNNVIGSIGSHNDSIFIGGGFTIIDTDTFNYIAKWDGGGFTDTCGIVSVVERSNEVNEASVAPSPFDKRLIVTLTTESHFTFTLFDLLGRIVRSVNDIGSQLVLERRGLPSGVYIYKITTERETQIGKIVAL